MLMSTPLPVPRGSQIGKVMGRDTNHSRRALAASQSGAFSRPLRCWKCSWCGVKQHNRQLCSRRCCRKPRGRCQQGEGTWIQLEKAAPVPVHHPKLWVWGSAAGKRLPVVSPALGVLGVLHPWRDGHRSQRAFSTVGGIFRHPLRFCDFWEPQKCWNVMKLELQGERGS